MTTSQDKGFQQRIQRIEMLTRKIEEAADPDLRASTRELLESVMELHGAAVRRMMEIVNEGKDPGLIDGLARDELVSSLFLLYGLHPDDFVTRVERAVERLKASARAHGNEIELLAIHEGTVRLRIKAGHGCGSGAATLKTETEQAMYEAAPDLTELVIEAAEEEPKSQFVPLEQLLATNNRSPV